MKTLLVIDDNKEILENTAEILDLAGYKVVTAENGKTGIELALIHKPDLVICDIMMPVLDGFDVLKLLQKNERIRDTPVIFLSAKAERVDFRRGIEMGADDYITKPFSGTELLQAVAVRLKSRLKMPPHLPGTITRDEDCVFCLLNLYHLVLVV